MGSSSMLVRARAVAGGPALGAVLALAAVVVGCRNKPAGGEGSERGDGAEAAASAAANGASTEPSAQPPPPTEEERDASDELYDASTRFRDAGPKVALDPDGPVDLAACSGPEISFNTVVVDPRCAIGSARARQLRAILEHDGGAPLSLRQEARLLPDGRVALRLVNTGPAPLTLPLSYSAKLPAFTVLAEDDRHTLYELEAPRFDVGTSGGTSAANDRPHFARIVLPPGGAALATLAVQPAVLRALGRGADAAAPARLAKGRYVLHVGELLTDVEAGAPARVTWDLP